MVAFYLQKHRVEALLIIGGFEGFEAMSELLAQRERFPQFCIPVVLLPASISRCSRVMPTVRELPSGKSSTISPLPTTGCKY